MKNKTRALKLASLTAIAASSFAHAVPIDVITDQTTPSSTFGVRVLTQNTTWTADNDYFLTDRLYIPNGITLTIEAGTKIYSSSEDVGNDNNPANDLVGAVIVARGGELIANGTPTAPIEFTSVTEWEAENGVDSPFDPDTAVGPAPTVETRGLWGGIILLGNAFVADANASGNIGNDIIEGFSSAAPGQGDSDNDGRLDVLEYGFDATFPQNDADSSGSLRYVSIRHGGFAFGPDNEINGLTLGGVGTGTTIEFVEVVSNNDDGVEFFGGTVNTNNIAVAFCGDDAYDIDQGHSGTHQFWFAIQNPDDGDNLGEWDGITGPNIPGLASSTQIFNATFVGPGASAFAPGDIDDDNGLFVSDFFAGSLRDSIIHDSTNYVSSFAGDGDFGTFENNIVGTFGRFSILGGNASVLNGAPTNFYLTSGSPNSGNTAPNTDPLFTTYTRSGTGFLTAIDPRPQSSSPALTLPVSSGAPTTVTYRGAFGPSENWLAGWSFLSDNNLVISNSPDTDGDGIADSLETSLGLNPAVANTAGEIEEAVNTAIAAVEQSLINLGAVEATIDTSTGQAIIEFELKSSDDLINFEPLGTPATFDVGLPTGTRFFRFEEQ